MNKNYNHELFIKKINEMITRESVTEINEKKGEKRVEFRIVSPQGNVLPLHQSHIKEIVFHC